MSKSDPQRALHVSNTSRCSVNIHTYLINEHEYPQDQLPFRLYIRFYDVLPRTCPCVPATDSGSYIEDSEKESSSVYVEMDTEIELFLARDYGTQDHTFYTFEPKEFTIDENSSAAPLVTLSNEPDPPPSCGILMRILPIGKTRGPNWYRPEPPPLIVRLMAIPRSPKLLVLPTKLHIQICALDLPANDILRIRKHIRVMNTGSGRLQTYAVTEKPWFLRIPQEQCFAKCIGSGLGSHTLDLELFPGSSTESMPLHLNVEFPKLQVEPSKIDFGYVMDGDYRKTYFTLMQTSSTITMEVAIESRGDKEYRIWPPRLTLAPRTRERVYVQFISRWQLWPAESTVHIRALTTAGVWCMTVVPLHAQSTLDRATHLPAHDYTDDSRLSTH
ncbi:uncharacterized protein LOC125048828 isoform X2 [Pieris napi]|uniref:uncharacterized protein LOC125048828 isoform X2 n=1 Tax=Pieris napi TaxID=78633 RepID=UPI001FBBDFE3|nr:uncharacterized protein LOC125048828 isoform X2 [Pieris napi]